MAAASSPRTPSRTSGVLGALVPGPAEFIGTAAAVLLASRYYVTKESTPEDDLAAFGASLPGEFPPAVDSILSPVQGVGERIAEIDLDILQDDIQQAPTRLQRWVGGLDDAAGTIAPPAAALGAILVRARWAVRTCRCSPSSCPGRWSSSAWRTSSRR